MRLVVVVDGYQLAMAGCNPPKGIGLIATLVVLPDQSWDPEGVELQSPEGDWADCDS